MRMKICLTPATKFGLHAAATHHDADVAARMFKRDVGIVV
jgi:hypothetical protein